MTNNLATLNANLAIALRDAAYATWTSAEMNDLLTWSAAQLYPTHSRAVDPVTTEITLVADTYTYTIPVSIQNISDVWVFDSSGNLLTELDGRAWFVEGDIVLDQTIRISQATVDAYAGGSIQLHGYDKYDLVSNLPRTEVVPLILARARSEAYRRIGADRERFKVWLTRNQNQNVSVNELLQFVREAEGQTQLLARSNRVTQRPVAGRQ
jgi:hypothetical protein